MLENPAQRTAVHESGHAVAALCLGIQFEAVELRIDAVDGFWHCGGRLRGAELPESADNRRLWDQLIVIMGGYASVSLFESPIGFSIRQFTFPDDRDFGAAVDILRSMQPPVTARAAVEGAMEEAWHDARRVIGENWNKMTTIADELVRRSHPHGETVACHIVLTPQDLLQLRPANSAGP